VLAKELTDDGRGLGRLASVGIQDDIDCGNRRYGGRELASMSDQRELPWPSIGLAISDPVSHDVEWRLEVNNEHVISRERVDDTLEFERGFCRGYDQEETSASGLLQRDDGRELWDPARGFEPRPATGELLRLDRPEACSIDSSSVLNASRTEDFPDPGEPVKIRAAVTQTFSRRFRSRPRSGTCRVRVP
jgi:hypothetical protein